jgi:hypothetical protein
MSKYNTFSSSSCICYIMFDGKAKIVTLPVVVLSKPLFLGYQGLNSGPVLARSCASSPLMWF